MQGFKKMNYLTGKLEQLASNLYTFGTRHLFLTAIAGFAWNIALMASVLALACWLYYEFAVAVGVVIASIVVGIIGFVFCLLCIWLGC